MDKLPKKARQKRFLEKYIDNYDISASCIASNIDRGTYYDWMEKDEQFKAQIEDLLSKRINLAQSALLALLQNPCHPAHYQAIKHVLSKDTTWSHQDNLQSKGELNLKVNLEWVDGSKDDSQGVE